MGLDTTFGCFNGPYSTFARFRKSLCLQIDIDINELKEYGGNKGFAKDLDHDIMPLINHSDCDGRLTIKECKRIVKGLTSIKENFDNSKGRDFDFIEMIDKFIDGCNDAIKKRKMVHFG